MSRVHYHTSDAPDDAIIAVVAATCGLPRQHVEDLWWEMADGNRCAARRWEALTAEAERNA